MKKRILASLLGAMMLLSALSGCGNSETGNTGNNTTDTEQKTEASAAETSGSGQTIKVWIPPYARTDAELTDQMFWMNSLMLLKKRTGARYRWRSFRGKVTSRRLPQA